MAYTNSWDEAQPAGSAAANTLDTIIQNLKKDVRERIEDAFPDWANDAVDPKRVTIHYGLAAAIPLTPNTGEFYYETDAQLLKLWDGSAWQTLQKSGGSGAYVEVGTLGARPAAGNAGRLYYATDVGSLYIDTGSAWAVLAGGTSDSLHGYILYNDAAAVGSKATGTLSPIYRQLSFFFQGNVDAGGLIYINRSELPSPMDAWEFQTAVADFVYTGGAVTTANIQYIAVNGAQIQIKIVNSTTGAIYAAGTQFYLFVNVMAIAP